VALSSLRVVGHDTTVAVIGGGNMGAALVGGLLRGGVAPSNVIIVETLDLEAR